MTARREWRAGDVSWRVNHDGALVAEWCDGFYQSQRFYGYTRREAARLVREIRAGDRS